MIVEASLGVALIIGGIGWGILLLKWRHNGKGERNNIQDNELPPPAAVNQLPNRGNLLEDIQNLRVCSLALIEARRKLYYLSIRQVHDAHKKETIEEIEAYKRYRKARSGLEAERLRTPEPFWQPIDQFQFLIQEALVREVYESPGDSRIHQKITDHSLLTIEQIDQIGRSFYTPISA